jgi:hypothetical protein
MKALPAVLTGWMVVSLLLALTTSGTGVGRPCPLPIPLKVVGGWWVETDAFALPVSTAKWRRAVRADSDEWRRISHWRQGDVQCQNEAGRAVGSGRLLYHKDAHTGRYRFSRFR